MKYKLIIFLFPITISYAFKISGLSPKTDGVSVSVDTSGPNERVHLNYTIIELFDPNARGTSGYYDDLRSSFKIHHLKSDTWYGLHMASVYSWRGSQYSDPAHDIAFKTLAENDTQNSTTSNPVSVVAKPINGGFRILLINRLGDGLKNAISAYLSSTCLDGQTYGGLYSFTSGRRSSKDFIFNSSRLPEYILHKDPSEWALESCHTVCWSMFAKAANTSYVLDSQCSNLTKVFADTSDNSTLWEEGDKEAKHQDAKETKETDTKSHDDVTRQNQESTTQKPSRASIVISDYVVFVIIMILVGKGV